MLSCLFVLAQRLGHAPQIVEHVGSEPFVSRFLGHNVSLAGVASRFLVLALGQRHARQYVKGHLPVVWVTAFLAQAQALAPQSKRLFVVAADNCQDGQPEPWLCSHHLGRPCPSLVVDRPAAFDGRSRLLVPAEPDIPQAKKDENVSQCQISSASRRRPFQRAQSVF